MANLQHKEVSEKAVVSLPVGPSPVKKLVTLAVANAPSLNDKWYMCRLPRCRIVGGYLMGRELDVNASATLRLDVGVLGGPTFLNDTFSGGTAAQTKIHACTTAIAGEATTDHVIGDGAKLFVHHLNKLVDGAIDLTDDENIVYINVTAVAATFAAGNVTLALDYNELPKT